MRVYCVIRSYNKFNRVVNIVSFHASEESARKKMKLFKDTLPKRSQHLVYIVDGELEVE